MKQKVPAIRKAMKSLAKKYPDYFEEEPPTNSLESSTDDGDSDDDDDDVVDEDEDDDLERGRSEENCKDVFDSLDRLSAPIQRLSKLVGLNLMKHPIQEKSMFEEDALDLVSFPAGDACFCCKTN